MRHLLIVLRIVTPPFRGEPSGVVLPVEVGEEAAAVEEEGLGAMIGVEDVEGEGTTMGVDEGGAMGVDVENGELDGETGVALGEVTSGVLETTIVEEVLSGFPEWWWW